MDKIKRDEVGNLERLAEWVWENIGYIAFLSVVGGALLLLFGAILVFLVMVWQDASLAPEQRFTMYDSFYNSCIESGIGESACETAALDYAGLDGE